MAPLDPANDNLTSLARWDDLIESHKAQRISRQASEQDDGLTSRQRMQRAILLAARLMKQQQGQENVLTGNEQKRTPRQRVHSIQDRLSGRTTQREAKTKTRKHLKVKKALEEQHYMEMIDVEHRYGSNLQKYKEVWERSDTKDNFLHWLDHGEGKNLSLEECSREKLDREKILYLSIEQRRHYLTFVDRETGRLRWAHPHPRFAASSQDEHPLVDTQPGRWADSNGLGILPVEDATAEENNTSDELDVESDDASTVSSKSSHTKTAHQHQDPIPPANKDVTLPAEAKGKKQSTQKFIYVADCSSNLYIGIKSKGHLQHSSFLSGGPISSAGNLEIHEGLPIKFSPMSGHYRTKTASFEGFLDDLRDQGCDLDKVHIGKTRIVLWLTQRANTLHTLKKRALRSKKDVLEKITDDK